MIVGLRKDELWKSSRVARSMLFDESGERKQKMVEERAESRQKQN